MEAESTNFLLEVVVPTIGSVVAIAMFLSNMPGVLKVRARDDLGDLNVLPYPAILANCVGWVCYSFVKPNGFILAPNAPGVLIGLFYMLTCLPAAPRRTADLVTGLSLLYTTAFLVAGSLTCYRDLTEESKQMLWGYTCNAILITYYAAPLSTLLQVWRTRNASSLSLPLASANAANGALWLVYGLAIGDKFVSVPNGIGLSLAIVLLFSIFTFWPGRGRAKADGSAARVADAPLLHDA